MTNRNRSWVFTLQPYNQIEPNIIDNIWDNSDTIKYICGQWEISKTQLNNKNNNQPYHYHLQGFINFKSVKSIQQVKDTLKSPSAHIEKMRGNHQQAIQYTQKIDETTIPNTWKEMGARSLYIRSNPL